MSGGGEARAAGAGRVMKEVKRMRREDEARRSTGGVSFGATGKVGGPLRLHVLHIKRDGKCMFRALVQGMAQNFDEVVGSGEETEQADALRLACNEALCASGKRAAKMYLPAVRGARAEYGTMQEFCRVSMHPRHWGGEVELLVLSKMLEQNIVVYRPLADGSAYSVIAEYGKEHLKKGRKPVRLLFNLRDHYDLLVAS